MQKLIWKGHAIYLKFAFFLSFVQRQLLDRVLEDICNIMGNTSSSSSHTSCSSPPSLPTTTITSCNFMSIQPQFYDGESFINHFLWVLLRQLYLGLLKFLPNKHMILNDFFLKKTLSDVHLQAWMIIWSYLSWISEDYFSWN